jgi:hypothetical protein
VRLYLEGQWRELVGLRAFRQAHALPADFGLSRFAPKHDDGLAHLDAAGQALGLIRRDVLLAQSLEGQAQSLEGQAQSLEGQAQEAAPAAPLARIAALAHAFEAALRRYNGLVGLREPEIDYAVAGLRDALEAWAFARLHPARAHESFAEVYERWVGESARLDQQRHAYDHVGQTWQVQIISTVYGRAGLRLVDPQGGVHWVADEALACPAEGFMGRLLAELAEGLASA